MGSLRNAAKRTATEATSRSTTWASWMDDRTTTAYSPNTHRLVPRSAAVAGKQQTVLHMAPQPSAGSRADEAELMWLNDADLLDVESVTAADSGRGRVFAKCIVPGLGLFAAVLFGHVILAASGQGVQTAAKPAVSAQQSVALPAAPSGPATAPSDAAQQQQQEPVPSTAPAAESSEPLAPADAALQPAAQPRKDTAAQTTSRVPPEPSARSHWQHYDDGAHGAGASEPSQPSRSGQLNDKEPTAATVPNQPGLLRINSRPWAQVTLDGSPLGNTPLFDVQVTPGAHTLLFQNPDFQVSKTIHVDVAAGETVTRVVSLQE